MTYYVKIQKLMDLPNFPILNFPSSGSGSRQKFQILADQDQTSSYSSTLKKTHLKFTQKEESYTKCSSLFNTTVQ